MMTRESRSGFALPVAVFALVVIGVLVTGGFYLARQETRIGVASNRSSTAFYLAERGANEVMSVWDMSAFGGMTFWDTTVTVTGSASEGDWTVDVTRMSSRLYFLEATGTVTAGSGMMGDASRSMGVIARLNSANIEPQAALTAIGDVRIQGSMQIDGYDNVPGPWASICDPPGAGKPGILIDDLDNINDIGKGLSLTGDPPSTEDPTMTSEDLLAFGDLAWEDLVALADKSYPHRSKIRQLEPDSTQVGGPWICDTSIRDNWGTPTKPDGACGMYFPIIYAEGDLDIAANEHGQGILLVEGDLDISGTHNFYGPVIIKGTLWASGTGSFQGGVIAANVEVEDSRITGNAIVEFSSCAVNRAVLNNSSLTRVRPIDDRSWVDLTSLIIG